MQIKCYALLFLQFEKNYTRLRILRLLPRLYFIMSFIYLCESTSLNFPTKCNFNLLALFLLWRLLKIVISVANFDTLTVLMKVLSGRLMDWLLLFHAFSSLVILRVDWRLLVVTVSDSWLLIDMGECKPIGFVWVKYSIVKSRDSH